MATTNQELLSALRTSFPQLFTTRKEGGQEVSLLDLEQIRALAGDGGYTDKYGLRWETKPEKFDQEAEGKLPSLKRVAAKRVQGDITKPTHILIEGDNYHALKVLQYTHEAAVDVIYIDPPYNTGNKDFKYGDDYVDKEDGYRHSKWLSFMAKRMRLAKTLLRDDGLVLVHIDENEIAQLKLLLDEIFGEANFRNVLCWHYENSTMKNPSNKLATSKEFVLIYCKNAQKLGGLAKIRYGEVSEKLIQRFGKYADESGDIRLKDVAAEKSYLSRILPRFKKLNGREAGPDDVIDSLQPNYLRDIVNVPAYRTLDFYRDFGLNFNNPKPVALASLLLRLSKSKELVVLDFFAGSGTAANAVMQLNAEDGVAGKRQCILVTNEEGEFRDEAGDLLAGGICTNVTYPRLRKVIEGYSTPKGKVVAGLGETLEYFQTAFHAAPESRGQQQAFMKLSTDVLCLKANCFEQVAHGADWALFKGADKHLFILYDDMLHPEVLKQLKDLAGSVDMFVFAYEADDNLADELSHLKNVHVQEVPRPLLDLFYRLKD